MTELEQFSAHSTLHIIYQEKTITTEQTYLMQLNLAKLQEHYSNH